MTIRVLLFAILRDKAGTHAFDLTLSPSATVSDAAKLIADRFPSLAASLPRIAYAVNQTYVKPDTILHDGDELALIPPVSGG